MEWLDRFKSMTQEQIVSTMVDMISYVSPDTFLKLTFMARMATTKDENPIL